MTRIAVRKWLINFFILLNLSFGTVYTAFADNSNPVDMLESIANQMIDGLRANKASLKTNPTFVYSLARKLVVPHADLAEMSKRVLPPSIWNSASSSQQVQFQTEFTTLLIRTYASALAEYTNETVKFYPIRGGYQGKTNILVNSQILRSDGPDVSVSYRLILRGSEWKLYDMTVEGISLLNSFRSQFADQVSQGSNMDDIIRNLKRHNNK
jgi:phospholipid transport system substrate-binding protein